MRMTRISRISRFFVATLAVWALPSLAAAAPTYVSGNECPADPLGGSDNRQYYVTQATHCVYDSASSNIQGTQSEADALLNALAAQPDWGTGWVGLGQDGVNAGDIAGFTYTHDLGNDDGTFTIDPNILGDRQFALAVKDGGTPKWAIFLLPYDTFSGDWGLSTPNGELSHFALFAHEGLTATPEPASLLLLGTGLTVVASRVRKRMKPHA